MELHNLVKTNATKKKRLGQGHGSGRVKTAGRGTKGQKARRNIPLSFEGGALSLIKRLPFLRGKGKNKAFLQKYAVINIADLANLPKDTVVDVEALVKHQVLSQKAAMQPVKILGNGSVSVPLEIRLPISKQAQEKIEKAGGKVVLS